MQPGYPLRDDEPLFHALRIRGKFQVFRWEPGAPLEQMWSCELYRMSPAVMSAHEYLGVASITYTTDVRQPYGKIRRW
jgi:hypothetical protein